MTSPLDGKTYCGSDAATNSYWRFYVKGKSDAKYKFADVGAGAYELHEGDAVTFMYAGDSDALLVRCLDPPISSVPMSTATILAGARQAMFPCPRALRLRTLLRRS
ncbi:MAG: DUF4430 domain-containing protein [Collinsella aerofaciens]